MRYSKEHKFQTHARIVKRASVKLREKGAHGIGVADLMKEAGLTHGGFYAHFDSRDALMIEAFTHAMDRSTEHWRKQSEGTPAEKRLSAIVNGYLSAEHRDNPGQGCAVPADLIVELRDRPGAGMAAPRNALLLRQQDGDVWRRAPLSFNQRDRTYVAPRRQPGAEVLG